MRIIYWNIKRSRMGKHHRIWKKEIDPNGWILYLAKDHKGNERYAIDHPKSPLLIKIIKSITLDILQCKDIYFVSDGKPPRGIDK